MVKDMEIEWDVVRNEGWKLLEFEHISDALETERVGKTEQKRERERGSPAER